MILLGVVSSIGAACALSAMPVTGGSPYPMIFFVIIVILLIVGMYVAARKISAHMVETMSKNGNFEGLIKALKNPFLAGRAARALGDSRDERAVEPLISALDDRDENIRCAAARALGEIGDLRAAMPLERASHDEYKEVRDCATRAIKRMHRSV